MGVEQVLREILKSEYGILTMKDLKAAIRNQGRVDLSVFCGKGEILSGANCAVETERIAV